MSTTSYKRLQRAIARDDKHSIESRWEYGRRVLTDPKKIAASGKSLRNGAIESLIAEAKAAGSPNVSRREIQRRIQCARAYGTITQLRHAVAQYEDWGDLSDAGFPSVAVDEVQSPDSLLDDLESTDPQEFEQLGLFPAMVRNIPLANATLGHLEAYAEEMRRMTESFARRDEERQAHLCRLLDLMHGNRDCLYVDALDALRTAVS